ncbi:MAG: hypothetical protein WCF85_07975 [Rhodospirillaceae bacterium]
MAGQFEVAFSESVMGVGIVAGGPYLCAKYDVLNMLTGQMVRCMAGEMGGPALPTLISDAKFLGKDGAIDSTANIAKHRVYMFSGANDTTVVPSVMEATDKFYKAFITDQSLIKFVKNPDARHAFIDNNPKSQGCSQACDNTVKSNQCTYVNNCNYDSAGALLSHIYGASAPLVDPATAGVTQVAANLTSFDQSAYINNPEDHSMAKEGHIYIPTACKDGSAPRCKLHIAFHGCKQATARIGNAFISDAGYNAWAEANRIVILYPEVVAMMSLAGLNPNGCWDWWGYDSPGEYYRKTGKQMAAIKRMVDALSAK